VQGWIEDLNRRLNFFIAEDLILKGASRPKMKIVCKDTLVKPEVSVTGYLFDN